jgi:hypothetical protein
MIRHLIASGYVLTECGETSAVPGSLMTNMDNVDCQACKRALMERGVCPACEEKGALSWMADGRLCVNVLYLACGNCSETLIPEVDLDTVAAALTTLNWRP